MEFGMAVGTELGAWYSDFVGNFASMRVLACSLWSLGVVAACLVGHVGACFVGVVWAVGFGYQHLCSAHLVAEWGFRLYYLIGFACVLVDALPVSPFRIEFR